MAQRNGNKRVERPRRAVKEALRAAERGREGIAEATASMEVLIRDHPVASVFVAALAGLGAALCLKALLR
jgi:ElaB/YqjD/DUF883 family membrane-anchored ribosome-binding protein